MIHDETNRSLRAYPFGKPTIPEWRGVAKIYIAVRNLDEASKRYQEAFALPAPIKSFNKDLQAQSARFANTPVVLVTAQSGWLAERLAKFGEAPCAFVIAASQSEHGKVRWLPITGMKVGVFQ
jgi:hypothetical protein